MIEQFVDSVLIIDNKFDEVKDLKKVLEERDIWVTYLDPPKERNQIEQISQSFRTRKLIFLDLKIDDTKSVIDNISVIIRPLLKKIVSENFGSYGIVMWTKHYEDINVFKNKIQNDRDDYRLPLFVVQMDKEKYLRENNFQNILSDLEQILTNNIAANFFINWANLIRAGRDKTIYSIFELIPDYQKQDKNLEFLLFKMAQNYTGIPFDKIDDGYPLSMDAIKAFNDLLVSEINLSASQEIINFNKENTIFILSSEDKGWFAKNKILTKKKELIIKKITKEENNGKIEWNIGNNLTQREKTTDILNSAKEEIISLFSELNSKLFLDYVNIHQDKVIPGNVYEIKGDSKLKHPELPNNLTPIIIEMTPPCDFSNTKSPYAYPRVLSGYITDLNISNLPNKNNFYTELWPIKLEGKDKTQIIIFDFSILGFVEETDLKDSSKYKLLFRVKDKLFADILQKMSTYIARLGLPIIR